MIKQRGEFGEFTWSTELSSIIPRPSIAHPEFQGFPSFTQPDRGCEGRRVTSGQFVTAL